MAVSLTDALARAFLDGMDATFNGGKLQFRTGAPPGSGQAPSGTLLAEEDLPADAFAAASGRSKAKNGTWQVQAGAGGIIGHYRMIAAGDTGAATQNEPRLEGTVTLTGGGGDMTVDNNDVESGQTITVTNFTISVP
jgi:hypothetical protein